MPDHRHARIDAGNRVFVIGSTPNDYAWLSHAADRGPEPWIVFAGALAEPYFPGSSVLLAPGPIAGSVAARGITRVRFAEYHDGQKVFDLERNEEDERGAVRYVVVEDRQAISAQIERDFGVWPMPLAGAAYLKRMAKMAYGWAAPWHTAWQASHS